MEIEKQQKPRFLLIGYGNMGGALVAPLVDSHDLTIASPNSIPPFQCRHVKSISDLADCPPFPHIVVACKPWQAKDVLQNLPQNCYDKDTILVSIMAGHDEDTLRSFLKGQARIAVVMPNLGVQVGRGISVAKWEGPGLEFLEKLGTVIYTTNKEEFSTIALVSGCGTGYVHQMMNAFESSWRKLGNQLFTKLTTILKLTLRNLLLPYLKELFFIIETTAPNPSKN